MTKATSLTLIALGAVLAFAVNAHLPFLNVQVVGWVIMATGAAGMLIPRGGYDAVRRRIVRTRYLPQMQLPASPSPHAEDEANLEARRAQKDSRAQKDNQTVETVDDYYITEDPDAGSPVSPAL